MVLTHMRVHPQRATIPKTGGRLIQAPAGHQPHDWAGRRLPFLTLTVSSSSVTCRRSVDRLPRWRVRGQFTVLEQAEVLESCGTLRGPSTVSEAVLCSVRESLAFRSACPAVVRYCVLPSPFPVRSASLGRWLLCAVPSALAVSSLLCFHPIHLCGLTQEGFLVPSEASARQSVSFLSCMSWTWSSVF